MNLIIITLLVMSALFTAGLFILIAETLDKEIIRIKERDRWRA